MLGLDVKSLIIRMSEQNFTNLKKLPRQVYHSPIHLLKWNYAAHLDTAPRLTASDKIRDAVHDPRINPRILGEA